MIHTSIFSGIIMSTMLWFNYPAIRYIENLNPTLADIESHLPPNNIYENHQDLENWAHEGTHGINSELRQQYGKPGFYVLGDRAVLLNEPQTTISEVARLIPRSLRGSSYNLYLLQSQRDWNNQPSYIFDEWTAYSNGCVERNAIGLKESSDINNMMDFIVYSICVLEASSNVDEHTKDFVRWQIERCLEIWEESGVDAPGFRKFQTSPDAKALRSFTRSSLGSAWTSFFLGF
jgi:hypothetical protein